MSRVWVELRYSLLQLLLRPTTVGCGVCSSCVSGFAALEEGLLIILVCIGLSVLFCFFLFL